MRIPIGQTFEFSIRVLEEDGLAPQDLHSMANAVFGVYDVNTNAEVFKITDEAAATVYGNITRDYRGHKTTVTTTTLKTTANGAVISVDEAKTVEIIDNIVEGHSEDTVETDLGDGTTSVVVTEVTSKATYKGLLRFALTSAATDKLAESRRGAEDGFVNKVAYRAVIVVNIDGRSSITAEIPRIEALQTPAL